MSNYTHEESSVYHTTFKTKLIEDPSKRMFGKPHLIKTTYGIDEADGSPIKVEHVMTYDILTVATEMAEKKINRVISSGLIKAVTEGANKGLLSKMSQGKVKVADMMEYAISVMSNETESEMDIVCEDDLRHLRLFLSEKASMKLAIELYSAYEPFKLFDYQGIIPVLALAKWTRDPSKPVNYYKKKEMKSLLSILAKRTHAAGPIITFFQKKMSTGILSSEEDLAMNKVFEQFSDE